jgi:hypothetical protein
MRRSRKKSGSDDYEGMTPVLLPSENLKTFEWLYNDEALQVIKATNHMNILLKNVDSSGFKDTQCLVEDMMENYYTDEYPCVMRKLYATNLHKSLMRDFHLKYPNITTDKGKKLLQFWSESFGVIAKWESTFRFSELAIDSRDVPSVAEVCAAFGDVTSTGPDEIDNSLFEEFDEISPTLSTFCQWFTPGGLSEVTAVEKPKRKQENKKKEVAVVVTKKPKVVSCLEHVQKGWHVEGSFKTRWVPGFWGKMSEGEKMEYRAQRGERGNWPADIPPCDQWINIKGQLFKTMFRTKFKTLRSSGGFSRLQRLAVRGGLGAALDGLLRAGRP